MDLEVLEYNMKVALVCIAKNEDNYIQEWIDYNLKLGFDNIFIYQNDWRMSIDHPKVTKFEVDGINKQRECYRHFIKNYNSEYDWAAFFDVDEFLVLKKHENIKEFIIDYNDFPGIGINWVLFGNNGLTKVSGEYSLLKRFTKRQSSINQHIKSIVKLNSGLVMGIHNPNTFIVDVNKNQFSGPFNPSGDDNIAQINHYFCKTQEEFQEKCDRGRADCPVSKRTMSEFDVHNFNDIEDLTAYNFLYK
jgi:hypothetical protein